MTYQNGLPVSIAEGALTPQQILGSAVEYGVVANKYKQQGHTETNFAVKHFELNNSQSIEIMGSGSNPIPFYIGKLDNNTYFWNGEATNVTFDVYINKNQSSKGPTDSNANVRYSRPQPPTNVYPKEQGEINTYVDTLLNHPVRMSELMAQKTTYTPTFPNNSKTIDLTGPAFSQAKNATIYVDCSNMKNIMSQDGWEIIKYEGQTIVFNMPDSGNYDIKKFKVTVKDANGGTVVSGLESRTIEKDGNKDHNGKVEKYILNHIVFNAYNASSLSIDTAAGIFLAPKATVNQNNGAGAGWVVTKKDFNSTAEWHYYFKARHYHADAGKNVNVSKTFTYQDGSELPANLKNKEFTFRMDEVDENTFQIKNGSSAYHATVIGKAGENIEFPKFNVYNTDFRCKPNGEIEGDQRINKYYVIQEAASDDDSIVTDAKKIYVKLEAHGYNKDQIDLKISYSEDHQNWIDQATDGNVGTFNNYKKQYTDVEVEKKWQKAAYNGEQITYVDSTGEHTADSVEVKLIAVKSLLKQGQGPVVTTQPQETSQVTSQPTSQTTSTTKPTATPTPTPTPKPTPVPVYTLRFESSDDSLSVEYKYKGGTTVQFWFDNGNQWWHPYEGIRLTGDVNGTIGNNGNKFTITMNSNKTIKLTQTGNSNWGNVVTNSLHLSPAANGSAYTTDGIEAKQLRAFDIRYHIAANGVSDVNFKSASTISSVQNGLKSVSEITGGKEYTVVDTQTLSKANNWKYKWQNLPKHFYDTDGSIYTLTYYIVETTATGAASNSYSGNGTGKVTITNTEEETSVTVAKEWADADNQDGIRPDSLTVDLMNGSTKVGTVTLNASNNWSATIDHLAKYENGQLITYTWSEQNLPAGYSLTNTDENGTITTLNNSHTPEKTQVTVTKSWNDANNQDGYRPSSVTVNLLADGTKIGSVELNAGNSWTHTWTDLDKYANGTAIDYTVTEDAVANYTTEITKAADGTFTYTVTNTHTTEKTKVKVTKVWEDSDNRDGYRPASVTVNLLADGTKTTSIELNEENHWTFEWNSLPKKAGGKDIDYTVTEDAVTNYTTEITKAADGSFTYNVKNTLETTTVSGHKTWNLRGADASYIPASITVYIKNGTQIVDTLNVIAGENNNWEYTSRELPMYEADGTTLINYTVDEQIPDGFEKRVDGNDITNNLKTTKIRGEKAWELKGNSTELLPEKITVYIKDGDKTVETLEVRPGSEGRWSFASKDLPKYRADGKTLINYTVDEEPVPGFEKALNGTQITNTLETVKITGEKTWDMQGYDASLMPDHITVYIKNGNDIVETLTVTAGEDNKWKFSSSDLPKYEKGTKDEITYTVDEKVPEGFSKVVTGNNITNTYIPKTTTVSGEKVWNLKGNSNELLPEEITVYIKDGDKTVETLKVKAGEDGKWTFTSGTLPKYRADGKTEIVYTADEEAIPGFEKVTEGTRITNTLETVKITGEKTWDMQGYDASLMPESITVYIKKGNDTVETLTVTAGEDNKWKFSSSDLPKYEKGTKDEITYTVDEKVPEGFSKVVTGNNITNTYIPKTTTVSGEKVWNLKGNSTELLPEEITVYIKDGSKTVETDGEGRHRW
ncbi:Cna B-type domain-containing protein [Clostridiales bacterium FE2011]|nr:Cna B-type domain-containing protein [Clostridiales bacterium FE2011]